jgi:hypothetical protein
MTCDVCKRTIKYATLEEHLAFKECLLNQHDIEAESLGMQNIAMHAHYGTIPHPVTLPSTFDELLRSMTTAGVNFKTLVAKHDTEDFGFSIIWAPEWVAQAVHAYNHRSGYAGLTLAQYLEMVKP